MAAVVWRRRTAHRVQTVSRSAHLGIGVVGERRGTGPLRPARTFEVAPHRAPAPPDWWSRRSARSERNRPGSANRAGVENSDLDEPPAGNAPRGLALWRWTGSRVAVSARPFPYSREVRSCDGADGHLPPTPPPPRASQYGVDPPLPRDVCRRPPPPPETVSATTVPPPARTAYPSPARPAPAGAGRIVRPGWVRRGRGVVVRQIDRLLYAMRWVSRVSRLRPRPRSGPLPASPRST